MDLDTMMNMRYGPQRYALRNVPGQEIIKVIAYTKGDPQYQVDRGDGTLIEAGISLRQLRPDPKSHTIKATHQLTGGEYVISLEE
ncbi:MAG: hypothetical protein JST60_20995 [Chloroflexi bacterium SZAS-1]|nr:hypothetical protein [Chloroflexi bacterium SZAS-1]